MMEWIKRFFGHPLEMTVNDYNDVGMTPLLTAIYRGDLEKVHELLLQGADPNKPQRDDVTATPLWHAEEDFGLADIAKLLKDFGAKPR